MFIGMTRAAQHGEPKVGMVEIPNPNTFALSGSDVICHMTAAANDSGVRAIEDVAGLSMVEIVVEWLPFDDVELGAQVVGVAGGAFLVAGRILHDPGVKASVLR